MGFESVRSFFFVNVFSNGGDGTPTNFLIVTPQPPQGWVLLFTGVGGYQKL